jgi:hypothetical protein
MTDANLCLNGTPFLFAENGREASGYPVAILFSIPLDRPAGKSFLA